jgi:hypothetical protein
MLESRYRQVFHKKATPTANLQNRVEKSLFPTLQRLINDQTSHRNRCNFIPNKCNALPCRSKISQIFTASVYAVCCVAAAVFLAGASSCVKEYSYEVKPVDSTPVSPPVNAPLASCSFCQGTLLPDSSWRFSVDGVTFCGQAEKTIITLERTSFTFFGPSACSVDSGFVASVYLDNVPLNSDKTNLNAKLVCYYYDRVKPSYLYMSQTGQYLQLTITSYVHQTGIASGTFSGFVSTENGIRKEVKDGKFRIRF